MSSKSSPSDAASLSIANLTKRGTPRYPFLDIKEKVLGKRYQLSLTFCADALSRKLNRVYREKDKVANVLSFPLTKESGEIFINLNKTEPFGVLHLFIHGLLHLKGMDHGARMESEEQRFLKLFNGATNIGRHRHRISRSKGGHRRGSSSRR